MPVDWCSLYVHLGGKVLGLNLSDMVDYSKTPSGLSSTIAYQARRANLFPTPFDIMAMSYKGQDIPVRCLSGLCCRRRCC